MADPDFVVSPPDMFPKERSGQRKDAEATKLAALRDISRASPSKNPATAVEYHVPELASTDLVDLSAKLRARANPAFTRGNARLGSHWLPGPGYLAVHRGELSPKRAMHHEKVQLTRPTPLLKTSGFWDAAWCKASRRWSCLLDRRSIPLPSARRHFALKLPIPLGCLSEVLYTGTAPASKDESLGTSIRDPIQIEQAKESNVCRQ
ncbi:hypothetical protein DL98DRAFT_650318 [Cadophora sp. DSE1049]|nr:hypothetical protein DL98DRAFT_650318 [Cadophora sp. DSE1049]